MDIRLEKNGKAVTYKAGNAYYLLLAYIPVIGWLILLYMTYKHNQFKGIILNQLVISLIVYAVSVVFYINQIQSLLNLWNMISWFFIIYIYLMYIFKANHYAVKQKLIEGYKITSPIDHQTRLFLTKVENVHKPFWQFVKF